MAETLGPHDEPQNSGALVAVHYGDYRYQEVWVRSGSNIGNWYPLGNEYGRPRPWDDPRSYAEQLNWTGPAPRPGPGEVPRHPHWEDVLARGPVTLLVAGQDETRAAGWTAGRRHLFEQIEQLADATEPASVVACPTCQRPTRLTATGLIERHGPHARPCEGGGKRA